MDANKFGCFVAERRKELKMTQKDLAAKIQVTDLENMFVFMPMLGAIKLIILITKKEFYTFIPQV